MAIPASYGSYWTPEEDATLVRMYDEGKTFTQIATALNRSVKGCKGHYYGIRDKERANGSQPVVVAQAIPDREIVPHAEPVVSFDLDQLLTTCEYLTGLMGKLPPALRPLVIDWLTKKYR